MSVFCNGTGMVNAAGWNYELKYLGQGHTVIAGLDEVGRGCWAGPLVAAAYVFHSAPQAIELHDSKQLSESQRLKLVADLELFGIASIGEVSVGEINSLGLQQAQYLAYERALRRLPIVPEVVLLDGRPWKTSPYLHEAVVGGDAVSASIAAAAIMAKTYRDSYMKTIVHERYPEFSFNTHVGYGTRAHQEALAKYGVLPVHRINYKPIQRYLVNG